MEQADPGGCLDEATALALVESRLPPEASRRAMAHVAGCASCRATLATLSPQTLALEPRTETLDPAPPAAPVPSAEWKRGSAIGRYLVLGELGQGGMGKVFLAFDPELDRKLALKVLVHDPGAQGPLAARPARLQREAQAMARLSHPNVVAVHDVGLVDGRLFIAMELVQGTTLRQWSREPGRTYEELLSTCIAAGRGLAAAHAAGLVHRDFKPDNVLVGADGSVKVTDFGLARVAAEVSDEALDEVAPVPSAGSFLNAEITRAGVIVGTPAYMAPEQLRGGSTGSRADQFAFCVTLYEALYGKRPFDRAQIRRLSELGKDEAAPELPVPAERRVEVPRWVHRQLARGLSASPEDRFESIDALLEALRLDPVVKLRRIATATAAAGIALAFGGYALLFAEEPCQGGAADFAQVWSPSRAVELAQRFEQANPTAGPPVFKAAAGALDRYAASWAQMHRDACLATRAGSQTSALLDLRMACLQRRRQAVGALVDGFAGLDGSSLSRAPEAVSALRSVESCANAEALLGATPLPEDEEARGRIEAIRNQVTIAQALHDLGKYREGVKEAEAAAAAAAKQGYAPLEAEAYNVLAWNRQRIGDAKGARLARFAAVRKATVGRVDETAVQAATELAFSLAAEEGDYEAANAWALQAAALLERMGGDDQLEGKLANSLGALAFREGRLPDATAEYERALALRLKAMGPEHLETAKVQGNLGLAYAARGMLAEAERAHRAATALYERLLGPDHPLLAQQLVNASAVLQRRRQFGDALAMLDRAHLIRIATLGADNPATWTILQDRALVQEAGGDDQGALASHQRALEFAASGPAEPRAEAMTKLAFFHERQGDYRRALELFQGAHALVLRSAGERDAWTLQLRQDLARVELRLGRARFARDALVELARVGDEVLGADHAGQALGRATLADAELRLGRGREALEPARRALATLEPLGWSDEHLAYPRYVLARAQAIAGERTRAVELARLAQAGISSAVLPDRGLKTELARWLAAHEPN